MTEKARHTLAPEQNVKGTQTTIPCHLCGLPMVVRENRFTGHHFLSCTHWPECDGTAEIVLIDPNQTALF